MLAYATYIKAKTSVLSTDDEVERVVDGGMAACM
jgi:hypothetical protein